MRQTGKHVDVWGSFLFCHLCSASACAVRLVLFYQIDSGYFFLNTETRTACKEFPRKYKYKCCTSADPPMFPQ